MLSAARLLLVPVGVALVHAGPSVVALGQWTKLRSLPNGWCRWRGPDVASVALTFDDGPDLHGTPRVLDALDALGLRGTFFCLGSRAAADPDLVMGVVDRGHEVALHGFAHDHHLARTPRWVLADMEAGLSALADCGVIPRWYRPPYGQSSAATMYAARRRRLELVHWSGWGREWEAVDAHAVADRVERSLEPGAIVLLHDSDDTSPSGTVDRVVDALPLIAAELQARGLTSSTMSDLVACKV
jgi:peptidoglycan/xylan/chitin deacetylase (PgdA/CDA1 family)